MIVIGFLSALLVLGFIVWRRHRAKVNAPAPLAGYDTGVRSAYRTPARFFHNRRTL